MKKLIACLLLVSLFFVGCGPDTSNAGKSTAKAAPSGSAK
jgi:hypothetical protein